jgi:hypothetical protein
MSSVTVLDTWEAGLALAPAARAELLLWAAGEDDVHDWPIGRRDRALLQLYCPDGPLEAVAVCPACATQLELVIDPQLLSSEDSAQPVDVELGDYRVTARPVTVGDLAMLPPGGEVAQLRALLVSRCVLTATRAGRAIDPDALPARVLEVVETSLDAADPTADLRVCLACTDCGAQWSETLDPVRFAWSAVQESARQLATEVLVLARGYGWSESEILGLSPQRRSLYRSAVAP